jgi:hypothetical protein
MLRYKTDISDYGDGAESAPLTLEGKATPKRRIVGLIVESDDLLIARAYVDQDRILDLNTGKAMTQKAGVIDVAGFIEMDLTLAAGQSFSAGYYNNTGGALTIQEITVVYEEG